ncbi:ROK family protein [Lysinibacillus piscis]|uniref:Glucokinase n=1 Tax=Lysinibacillus piscis TaxID=2518931 RepID=A0ABQ5NMV0_9BACI|nr:ROK family protein [Lysinibacillus sp. KH24]GLC89570.1 glucokinase [Lysinibacillus sp. KH24]
MAFFAVIDLGGTSIKHSVMDGNGIILHSGSTPTPIQGQEATFPVLSDIIQAYQQEFDVEGVALSIPGAVDCQSGYVYYAGAVKDIEHQSIKEKLSFLKLPIELDNDANCAALAEKWKGNAQECQSFVCYTAGTGIGGGIFINGDMYRGKNGLAGEFGLMTLGFDKHLETIIERYSFSNLGSARSLTERYFHETGEQVDGIELFGLMEQGNQRAVVELDRFYDALAVGTANIIHSLAPEKVLIGGGISAQPTVISEVKKRVECIWPEAVHTSEIDSCFFKNDAGKIGALFHFLTQRGRMA